MERFFDEFFEFNLKSAKGDQILEAAKLGLLRVQGASESLGTWVLEGDSNAFTTFKHSERRLNQRGSIKRRIFELHRSSSFHLPNLHVVYPECA